MRYRPNGACPGLAGASRFAAFSLNRPNRSIGFPTITLLHTAERVEVFAIGREDPDPSLRMDALQLLALSDSDLALAPLYQALDDTDERIGALPSDLLEALGEE